jgi:hypothetical protein
MWKDRVLNVRHPRESGNPSRGSRGATAWPPAFAGVTNRVSRHG